MSSVLEAVVDAGALPAEEQPRIARTPASEEAVRLALQLRDIRSSGGGRTVLFVPASIDQDASAAAGDALRGLLELHEGPVLVMDLRANANGGASGAPWPEAPDGHAEFGQAWGTAASSSATIARPFEGRRDSVLYAASSEFAEHLAAARTKYPHVLCVGGAVSASVETFIASALFDAVILSVAPERTTRAEMQRVTAQLRRARANVIGFVFDARKPRKRD